MNLSRIIRLAWISILCCGQAFLPAQECTFSSTMVVTDDFFFAASGDQGAVGDVVGVEISLQVSVLKPWLVGFGLVGCFDAEKMELLDAVAYSEEFHDLCFISYYYHLGEREVGPQRSPAGEGFSLGGNFRREVVEPYLGSPNPVPLMTLFFRLVGEPGDVTRVSFCDAEFEFQTWQRPCLVNYLYHVPSEGQGPQMEAMSKRHMDAEIRILPGPVTRPEPPPVPPDAAVYEDAPGPDEVSARFELTGAVALPGERGVPLDLYITSAREFSGFIAGIVFGTGIGGDPRNDDFEIVKVDEWTRPGAVTIRPDTQAVGIAMASSRRRVGLEGERVKVATIYIDISDSAQAGSEIQPRFSGSFGFKNSVFVQMKNGGYFLPVETRVEPLHIEEGFVKIVGTPIRLGDVNADGALDLTDPIALLNYLFVGRSDMLCAGAADCNSDLRVDMADPITLLIHLVGGRALYSINEVDCR